jgi:hypothetical protein
MVEAAPKGEDRPLATGAGAAEGAAPVGIALGMTGGFGRPESELEPRLNTLTSPKTHATVIHYGQKHRLMEKICR